MKTKAKNMNRKEISIKILSIVVLFLIFIFAVFKYSGIEMPSWFGLSRSASVHFIDIGQGDAALILTDKASVVVDTGPAVSSDTLIEYIKSYVSEIDCLIITHPHEDHMGGAARLIERCKVNVIIMNGDASDSGFFGRTLDVIDEKDVPLYKGKPGDTYDIGDISLELFAPLKDYGDKNNNSIVVKTELSGFSVLFTGDAEAVAEEDILDRYKASLRADILKVGHHGSSTSTTEDLLSAVSPSIAVISCGSGNPYGHPHSETLTKLNSLGVKVYRTDKDGTVALYFKNGKIISK